MRFSTKFFACICISSCALIAHGAAAQNAPAPPSKPQTPSPPNEAQTRITIEVTGGDKSVPVETPACTLSLSKSTRC